MYFGHDLIPPECRVLLSGVPILASKQAVSVGKNGLPGVLIGVSVHAGNQPVHIFHQLLHAGKLLIQIL